MRRSTSSIALGLGILEINIRRNTVHSWIHGCMQSPASHRIRQFRCPSLRQTSSLSKFKVLDSLRPGAAHSDSSVHVSASLYRHHQGFGSIAASTTPHQRGPRRQDPQGHFSLQRHTSRQKSRWNVEVFETTRRRCYIRHGWSTACPLLSPVLL